MRPACRADDQAPVGTSVRGSLSLPVPVQRALLDGRCALLERIPRAQRAEHLGQEVGEALVERRLMRAVLVVVVLQVAVPGSWTAVHDEAVTGTVIADGHELGQEGRRRVARLAELLARL